MKVVRYKSWNWEFDYGQDFSGLGPIRTSHDTHADAYFDVWGRLFRVVAHDPGLGHFVYE